MGTLYIQDPQKISKYLLSLSYTSCDEMIKIHPAKIGLKQVPYQMNYTQIYLQSSKAVSESSSHLI